MEGAAATESRFFFCVRRWLLDEDEDEDEEEEEEPVRRSSKRKPRKPAKKSKKPAAKLDSKVARQQQQQQQPIATTAPVVNLFDMDGSSPSQPAPAQPNGGGGGGAANILQSIFGDETPVAAAVTPSQPVQQVTRPAATTMTSTPSTAENKDFVIPVFNSHGVTIIFQCRTDASRPGQYRIRAVFTNSNAANVTDFDMKVAVPPWMKKVIKPAQSTTLAPGQPVYQFIQIMNNQLGSKASVMKIKLDFVVNGTKQSISPITINQFK